MRFQAGGRQEGRKAEEEVSQKSSEVEIGQLLVPVLACEMMR